MAKNTEKDFPAGHERDEFNRKQRDLTAEENAKAEELVDAIDPAKLDVKNVDNEIARWVDLSKGNIPVSNPRDGYRYIWVISPDSLRNSDAIGNCRAIEAKLRARRYFPVTDSHDTETKLEKRVAWEHRGENHAVGSSLRGIADVILFGIKQEHYEEIMDEDRRKRLRDMGIETDIPKGMQDRVFGLEDQRIKRAYGTDAARPITYSAEFAQPNGGK